MLYITNSSGNLDVYFEGTEEEFDEDYHDYGGNYSGESMFTTENGTVTFHYNQTW